MGKIGEKDDIDFVISTGDNFYNNGIKGVNDPTFLQSFSNIYTAKSLQKQWYTGMSNHFNFTKISSYLSNALYFKFHTLI